MHFERAQYKLPRLIRSPYRYIATRFPITTSPVCRTVYSTVYSSYPYVVFSDYNFASIVQNGVAFNGQNTENTRRWTPNLFPRLFLLNRRAPDQHNVAHAQLCALRHNGTDTERLKWTEQQVRVARTRPALGETINAVHNVSNNVDMEETESEKSEPGQRSRNFQLPFCALFVLDRPLSVSING